MYRRLETNHKYIPDFLPVQLRKQHPLPIHCKEQEAYLSSIEYQLVEKLQFVLYEYIRFHL